MIGGAFGRLRILRGMDSMGSVGFVFPAAGSRRVRTRCCTDQATSAPNTVDGRGFSVPAKGQVVIIPGKWPGQDGVGVVEGVQVKLDKTSYVVDVTEMKQINGSLYGKPRQLNKQKRRLYDVGDVRVVSTEFLPEQDAFLVDNVRDGYPDRPMFDDRLQVRYNEEYAALKSKQLREAATVGVIGTVAATILGDPSFGITYATGAASGIFYLFLLQQSIDRIGRASASIYLSRYLLPLVPFLILGVRDRNVSLSDLSGLFFSLPRIQVLTAAFGFLSYRLPILLQSAKEVTAGLQAQEIQPRGTLSTILATAQRMSKEKDGVNGVELMTQRPMVVFSGCSGVGKSSLIGRLLREFGNKVGFSVSYTTRKRREGEVEGVNYHFVGVEEFQKAIADGKFVEWAEVHGNFYGTSIDAISEVTAAGRVCLLDVDVQGVERVQQNYASNGIFVWIAPPSIDALEERLRKRGTDSDNVIQARLKEAVNELSFAASSGAFDYTIINDNFDRAYAELKGIIESVVG